MHFSKTFWGKFTFLLPNRRLRVVFRTFLLDRHWRKNIRTETRYSSQSLVSTFSSQYWKLRKCHFVVICEAKVSEIQSANGDVATYVKKSISLTKLRKFFVREIYYFEFLHFPNRRLRVVSWTFFLHKVTLKMKFRLFF